MIETATTTWHEANQRSLMAALGRVRGLLEGYVAGEEVPPDDVPLPTPYALEQVCATFGLSAFERDVLLLCAGIELDGAIGALCATATGDPQGVYPTFSLALAALPGAHWSALSPAGPLRHWQLIEVDAGAALVTSRLRIDEYILHFLCGTSHQDAHLCGFIRNLPAEEAALVPSHQAIADEIASVWRQAGGGGALPVAQLCGREASAKRPIAAAACAALGLKLSVIPAEVLPTGPHEFDILVRLWEREAALTGSALLIEDDADETRVPLVNRFVEVTRGPMLIAVRERRRSRYRPLVSFEVDRPTAGEQRARWQARLGEESHALNGQIDRLATQFDLNVTAIDAACTRARAQGEDQAAFTMGDRLWEACRLQARPKLDNLAQRIEPSATWDDLVLPEPQRQTLREVALHVRHRARVYETWGFAGKSRRGLGISALFYGASGTGKTMAAEVLANDLRLDLYHIDLSQVVSKYIGETEKNLGRVFDAAEEGGAVLLFDEADALFGKRTEVKDSHDRYANIEVSYLLQRMEAYRGLAILTTNMKGSIDDAFLRRIRFTVSFPFPDAAQRAEIWGRIFPAETPTEGLDIQKLARLNVAGGNIRNIALGAAFLAADAEQPVSMAHLLRATRGEYAKLEKSLTDLEIRGWL